MLTNNWRIVFLVVALGLLLGGPTRVAAGSENERVKALYLYNFLLFVDWPEQALGSGDPIRLTVTGDDVLFATLRGMGKMSVKGRDLVIDSFASPEDLPSACHAVFIGAAKWGLAPRIMERIRDRPVLTISDMAGFAQMGGMVCFKHVVSQEDNGDYAKRFEINVSATERAGLKIRSRLLRLSDIVE